MILMSIIHYKRKFLVLNTSEIFSGNASRKSIAQQTTIIVPVAIHDTIPRVFDQFGQPAPKDLWPFFLSLHRVYAHPLVQRRKGHGCFPDRAFRPQSIQYFGINHKTGRRQLGEHCSSGCGHTSELFQSTAVLLIEFRPQAVPLRLETNFCAVTAQTLFVVLSIQPKHSASSTARFLAFKTLAGSMLVCISAC